MQTIGKYQVLRVLGRGGMGTVYEALDPLIHRKVAVKTMIPGLTESPDLRVRFLREAQAAGGLRHRNIVTVYDLGEDRGQPYIAMEFIEGTDLEKVIQQREPRTMEWKLDVLRQICDGLGYAHRCGIVHRDIKPANIRVTPEGEVKIMDFGIAHLQSSTMTRSGLVLGTVHYMAPEQIEGHKVDHRADIFSVGAIAYELITYRRPFEGDTLTAVMYKIMHERPDTSCFPRTDFSPGIDALVSRALARDVRERYQELDRMQADLEDLIRDGASRTRRRTDPIASLLANARSERTAGRLEDALRMAREALRLSPANADAVALAAELEREEREQRLARCLEEARRRLEADDEGAALEWARKALEAAPELKDAQALVQRAEERAARRKHDQARAELQADMERAHGEGRLPKALSLSRRLLELSPGDEQVARTAAAIQATIQDREVEQLCGLALSYVAEGDIELAFKIAGKIQRLAPENPRYLHLHAYLQEESSRRQAESVLAVAQEALAQGNLEEAQEAAEKALAIHPSHSLAREIRDRAASVLAKRKPPSKAAEAAEPSPPPNAGASTPPQPAASANPGEPAAGPSPTPAPAASPEPTLLTPLPEGPPADPEAARLFERARRLLRERQPQQALPLLEQAAAHEPDHAGLQRVLAQTRVEARRVEAEALTTAALNHFVKNEYAKARKAVDKALALEPGNRRARELQMLLGTLA